MRVADIDSRNVGSPSTVLLLGRIRVAVEVLSGVLLVVGSRMVAVVGGGSGVSVGSVEFHWLEV